jgi:tetratricopeptide (TPR) repeat protein
MTGTIEVRRSFVAVMVGGMLCLCGAQAQGPQSARHAGAKAQAAVAAPDDSGADGAAYAKLNAGQVDEAAAAFQAVLAAQPKDAGALAGMGQVRMLQGNYMGAVSFLEQAKQASPNDAAIAAALDGARYQFLMGEGKSAQQTNHLDDAEKRYRDALALRPDTVSPVTALANVLVLENRLGDAQQVLATAVAHTAAATGRPPAELAVELAEMDIANGQPQAAYPLFRQVLVEQPDRLDAWSGLISTLHLMGHDADASAQETAIPAATRAQLESTAGFQQMMTAIGSAPAQSAVADPAYAPFVPSAVVVAPATALPPATAASVPAVQNPQSTIANPQRPQASAAGTPLKASVTKPVAASAAPKAIAAAPAPQTTKAPAALAQAVPGRASAASGAPLVTQPAARPANRVQDIPDTGEQQYPQPKARPRVASGAAVPSSAQQ